MSRLAVTAGLLAAVVAGSVAGHTVNRLEGGGGQLLPIARFEVTSGTWRAAGAGGVSAQTSSPTFRARSAQADLGSPRVDLLFRVDRFLDGPEVHDWDGVHVGVRSTSPDDLYYVSVARRDGSVAVKRKSGGHYETLAVADHDLADDDWHRATVTVADTPGGTRLQLSIDGEPVLEARDDVQHALSPGGRVLVRSDNVSAAFADVRVTDDQ